MNLVESIVDNNLCIGCGYCTALANTTTYLNDEGFLVPDQRTDFNLTQRAQNLVQQSCPGVVGNTVVSKGLETNGGTDDYMWGRYHKVVTAWSTDDEIRHNGSSGGALTGLAKWLISSGRVNSVLITHYNSQKPIETSSGISENTEEIFDAAGSKYCPSSPLSALAKLAEHPGKLAVIGRPCDIATLRRAISAGDPITKNVEVLLSFFCAGTPSNLGNRELLKTLKISNPDDVVNFRHRGQGWPGETRADLKSGESVTCTYNQSWGQVLRKYVHTLCKICPDGIGEAADIVAADAWHGDEDGYPIFNETNGRSLVIARTQKGKAILDAAVRDKALASQELAIREIDSMQPGQINRRRQLALRIAAYRIMGLKTPIYNWNAVNGYQSELTFMMKSKIFIATIKRLIKLKFKSTKVSKQI